MVPELEASMAQLPPPERAAPPPAQTESVRGPAAAPASPGLAALLVPAAYVDLPSLLRMRDRRQRQALLDALYRGCNLCYRM